MYRAIPMAILAAVFLVNGLVQAGEIEDLLCRINSGSPFVSGQVRVSKTVARLMPPRETEDHRSEIRREAVIEKDFSFAADYDPVRQEFLHVRPAPVPRKGRKFPRSDLAPAVRLLLKDQCRSVQIFADSRSRRRGLRVWGRVAYDVEVAFGRDSRVPVFYQRLSAFSGAAEREVRLTRQQILEIFDKRYKKLFPLPANARLDQVWMADYPLSPIELVPVAEIWYRRKDRSERDYLLFQFNPVSHELTLYEKNWSTSRGSLHGG